VGSNNKDNDIFSDFGSSSGTPSFGQYFPGRSRACRPQFTVFNITGDIPQMDIEMKHGNMFYIDE